MLGPLTSPQSVTIVIIRIDTGMVAILSPATGIITALTGRAEAPASSQPDNNRFKARQAAAGAIANTSLSMVIAWLIRQSAVRCRSQGFAVSSRRRGSMDAVVGPADDRAGGASFEARRAARTSE
jgi:hypothetical protein